MSFFVDAKKIILTFKGPETPPPAQENKPPTDPSREKLVKAFLLTAQVAELKDSLNKARPQKVTYFAGAPIRSFIGVSAPDFLQIEINPKHFDRLTENEKVFVYSRELEKARRGWTPMGIFRELTAEENISLDIFAAELVGKGVARTALNKLVYFLAEDIQAKTPLATSTLGPFDGFKGNAFPQWFTASGFNYNAIHGAVTAALFDTSGVPVEMFHYNDRLEYMNAESGLEPMVLDPETHADINFGNLSFTENQTVI